MQEGSLSVRIPMHSLYLGLEAQIYANICLELRCLILHLLVGRIALIVSSLGTLLKAQLL